MSEGTNNGWPWLAASKYRPDGARERCRQGWHDDPDNSGMCIYCSLILDVIDGEDPNEYRRRNGWPDVPVEPRQDR